MCVHQPYAGQAAAASRLPAAFVKVPQPCRHQLRADEIGEAILIVDGQFLSSLIIHSCQVQRAAACAGAELARREEKVLVELIFFWPVEVSSPCKHIYI